MWLVGEGDLLLIGRPAARSPPRLDRIAPGVADRTAAQALATVGIAHDDALPSTCCRCTRAARSRSRATARRALIQTDDRTGARILRRRAASTAGPRNDNAAAIRALGGEPPPPSGGARRGDRCRLGVERPDAARGRGARPRV